MKLRRGCGCPLVILAAANLFFVIGAIIRIAAGPSQDPVTTTTPTLIFGLLLFLCNLVVAGIMALVAFRGQPMAETGTEEHEDSGGVEFHGEEGDDEAPSGDA